MQVKKRFEYVEAINHFLYETKHASMTIEIEPGDAGGSVSKIAKYLKVYFKNHNDIEIIAKQPNIIWIERVDWRQLCGQKNNGKKILKL